MNTHQIVAKLHTLGGFAGALGDAWQRADSANQFIIESAFEHLFRRIDPRFFPGRAT